MATIVTLAATETANCELDYIGIETTFVEGPTGPLAVRRIYAYCTDPGDRLFAWGSSPDHPTTFGTTCHTPFFDPPQGGILAPSQAIIDQFPFVQWDTFATINITIAEQGPGGVDQTVLLGEFPHFIDGDTVTWTDNIVLVSPESPQGRADYIDPVHKKILLVQLTTSADEGIINAVPAGKIGFITVMDADGGGSTYYDYAMNYATPYGRCCLANGGCITTDHASCLSGSGNQYIGCQPCTDCNTKGCDGDIAPPAGDGIVNVEDLVFLVVLWGPCSASCPPDINGDGTVNVADLLGVINAWGPCE